MKPQKAGARNSKSRKRLTVCVVDYGDDEGPQPMVLIEGYAEDLEALGELFIERAKDPRDCGFWFSPIGPRNKTFSSEATHGIYIHRLPCLPPPPPRR